MPVVMVGSALGVFAYVTGSSVYSKYLFFPHIPGAGELLIRVAASGINRPVIHTSVHQPVDDKKPGLSLMIFGQYFNRHDSWAEMAKPWVDYISRTSFMLQQGRNHADIAYFYGEESPVTGLFEFDVPKGLPIQYAYDFVNSDMLHDALSVDSGEIVAKGVNDGWQEYFDYDNAGYLWRTNSGDKRNPRHRCFLNNLERQPTTHN